VRGEFRSAARNKLKTHQLDYRPLAARHFFL
jgi:hypothetical protein